MTPRTDLTLVAAAFGDSDDEIRWFMEAAALDHWGTWYSFRDFGFLDPIRDRAEFRSWLRESEDRRAAQRRQLAAMGEWTPEAVFRSPGG